MKKYIVHKNVEEPLKIWGMMQKYFYIYCSFSAIVIISAIGLVMGILREGFQLGKIFSIVVIAFFTLIGLRLFFIFRSGKKKYKETNRRITISNYDITRLKRKVL